MLLNLVEKVRKGCLARLTWHNWGDGDVYRSNRGSEMSESGKLLLRGIRIGIIVENL